MAQLNRRQMLKEVLSQGLSPSVPPVFSARLMPRVP
jgi:hypothetical protein